jgi:hypothetical protein
MIKAAQDEFTSVSGMFEALALHGLTTIARAAAPSCG